MENKVKLIVNLLTFLKTTKTTHDNIKAYHYKYYQKLTPKKKLTSMKFIRLTPFLFLLGAAYGSTQNEESFDVSFNVSNKETGFEHTVSNQRM